MDLLNDPQHCGACGALCEAPGVQEAACIEGVCKIVECGEGLANADGVFESGCGCTPSEEVCDGEDNDCDGIADDFTEACDTSCGKEVARAQPACFRIARRRRCLPAPITPLPSAEPSNNATPARSPLWRRATGSTTTATRWWMRGQLQNRRNQNHSLRSVWNPGAGLRKLCVGGGYGVSG